MALDFECATCFQVFDCLRQRVKTMPIFDGIIKYLMRSASLWAQSSQVYRHSLRLISFEIDVFSSQGGEVLTLLCYMPIWYGLTIAVGWKTSKYACWFDSISWQSTYEPTLDSMVLRKIRTEPISVFARARTHTLTYTIKFNLVVYQWGNWLLLKWQTILPRSSTSTGCMVQ